MLKRMLEEQLVEYQTKLNENQNQFIELMKNGKQTEAIGLAKKGAGIKMMLDHTIQELSKLKS